MRKGSRLPRYRCTVCGYEWARGGRRAICKSCGDDNHRNVEFVSYGWDGIVRTFDKDMNFVKVEK